MNRRGDALPIDAVLQELIQAYRSHGGLVLKAPPGAGKTTGVPPALLDAIEPTPRMILTQPRRIAARTAARRLAQQCGTTLGDGVGYQVRFDRRWHAGSQVVAMTTGILLRRLQHDPFLEGFDAVLLDEFHERTLECDLALGMLLRLRQTVRPDLRLIVMSATLDPQPIADFLSAQGTTAAVIESRGRAFPVEVRYARRRPSESLEQQIAEAVGEALRATSGHVLVFLPGVGEIRRVSARLQREGRLAEVRICELYGDLPAAQQDAVIQPCAERKVVLATNVAETSVTIDGVTAVIDSGTARVLRDHGDRGIPRLEVEAISRASADQRAGRAGRTAPGIAWRLWPQAADRGRPERETPEVQRSDLVAATLQLLAWGEHDLAAFPWLDAPSTAAMTSAKRLLSQLEATDQDRVTSLGQAMLRLPVHPRLAKLLLESLQWGIPERGCLLAAMLSERDPFRAASRSGAETVRKNATGRTELQAATTKSVSRSDLLDQLELLEKFVAGHGDAAVDPAAARHVQRVARALSATLLDPETTADLPLESPPADIDQREDEAVLRCLLAAFPDRLVKRRQPGSERGVMAGGLGVRLSPRSRVRQDDFFLAIDVQHATGDARVHRASAVQPEWLGVAGFETREECFFHPTQRKVVARRRQSWNGLRLSETPIERGDPEQVQAVLYAAALRDWDRVFPADDESLVQWIARVRFLRAHASDDLPDFDRQALQAIAHQLCRQCESFAQLRKAPWLDYLQASLTHQQQQQLDREAPAQLTLPNGSQHRLVYENDRPPILPVRIQEVFGWRQSPRLAGGRVPVLLHLLAPNGRPQQVTDDLESFWKQTYPQVRKDLRGRYSKHYWPEDPFTAKATRSGLARDARQS